MHLDQPLRNSRIELRSLQDGDVGPRYLSWLNDPDINRFLEVRFHPNSLQSTIEFVREVNASADTLMLGIFVDGGRRHIGNIKIGPINPHHLRADIGLLIGDRAEWGKGYATEAISLISAHGFGALGLRKITAGCYGANTGSLRAFEKAGYRVEARLPRHWSTSTGLEDEILLGLEAKEFGCDGRARSAKRFGMVRKIALIGGGDLMIETAAMARREGYEVTIVMAPRHADESLPLSGQNARVASERAGARVVLCDDINIASAVEAHWSGSDALALCFGPAWIFGPHVIAAFGAGMLNFNGIPIPHYLGGAHYTWQILNGHRQGGCFLQEIGAAIDRGDILRGETFELDGESGTPRDYFAANHRSGVRFLREVIADFRANKEFQPVAFSAVNARRLYFPRLQTRRNALINWSWTAAQIASFCQAFDDPYPGSATFAAGREVRFRGVALEPSGADGDFHPFTAGLVVRKIGATVWIAAAGGLLRVARIEDESGREVVSEIREGTRFATPPEALHHAATFVPSFGAR